MGAGDACGGAREFMLPSGPIFPAGANLERAGAPEMRGDLCVSAKSGPLADVISGQRSWSRPEPGESRDTGCPGNVRFASSVQGANADREAAPSLFAFRRILLRP